MREAVKGTSVYVHCLLALSITLPCIITWGKLYRNEAFRQLLCMRSQPCVVEKMEVGSSRDTANLLFWDRVLTDEHSLV